MGTRLTHAAACLTAAALLAACGREAQVVVVDNRIATVQAGTPPAPTQLPMRLEPVADALPAPTALAALPEGGFLVATREGALLRIDAGGAVSPVAGVPASAPGGIFDVATAPGFIANRRIYLLHADPDPAGGTALALAWATLDDAGLSGQRTLFRLQTAPGGALERAALAFDGRGHLFVGFDLPASASPPGAIPPDALLRLLTDGRIPQDNLWPTGSGVPREAFSLGHGRIGALGIDPRTGLLWSVEDAGGGSELNLPRFGQRYGPSAAAPGTLSPAAEQPPRHAWPQPLRPRGMAFLAGAPDTPWAASLFVAGGDGLQRLQLRGNSEVVSQERIALDGVGALADVAAGPDGQLYLLTAGPRGRLLRLRAPTLLHPAPGPEADVSTEPGPEPGPMAPSQ